LSVRVVRAVCVAACLEWSTLCTLTSFVASQLVHTDYLRKGGRARSSDSALAVAATLVDATWLLLTWLFVATNSTKLFLCCWSRPGRGGQPTHEPRSSGRVVFAAHMCVGLLHPLWLLEVTVRLDGTDVQPRDMFIFDNAVSATTAVSMRVGVLVGACMVWRSATELHSYYAQRAQRVATDSNGTGEVTKLPEYVQQFVRSAQDERAIATCRTGTKVAIVHDGGGGRSGMLGGYTKQRECFMQLSDCLTSLRWSWTDYLLIDEIVRDRARTITQPWHVGTGYGSTSQLKP
jgi:hypothetical protein